MGPQHVTPEVSDALRAADYVVAVRKDTEDELLEVRRQVCAEHGLELVEATILRPARQKPARAAMSRTTTCAVRDGDHYVLNGRKLRRIRSVVDWKRFIAPRTNSLAMWAGKAGTSEFADSIIQYMESGADVPTQAESSHA